MKKPNLLSIALLTCVVLILFACGEDCPDGFSGEDCAVRESDKFVAAYEGFVDCGPGNEYVTLDIFRKTGPFDVTLQLAYPPDFTFDAMVRGDTLTIPEQVVRVANGTDTSYYILFDSMGRLQGDTLSFQLILLFPGIPEQQKVYCQYEVIK